MPKAKDGGMGFVTINNDLELGFKETINWRDDEVIFLGPPLEVVLQTDLDRGGVSKRGGDDGFVVYNVEQLGGGKAFVLGGPQLSIGPPILVPRHYFQQSGRNGGKGASSKF